MKELFIQISKVNICRALRYRKQKQYERVRAGLLPLLLARRQSALELAEAAKAKEGACVSDT